MQKTAKSPKLKAESEYRIQLNAKGPKPMQKTAKSPKLKAESEYRIQLNTKGLKPMQNTAWGRCNNPPTPGPGGKSHKPETIIRQLLIASPEYKEPET